MSSASEKDLRSTRLGVDKGKMGCNFAIQFIARKRMSHDGDRYGGRLLGRRRSGSYRAFLSGHKNDQR